MGGCGGRSGKPPGWWGGCRSRPRGLRGDGEVQALTAGHHLPLQVVPGQVQHPEDRIVQEDEEQRDEELPEKVGDRQEVKKLLPPGQVEGAWGGEGGSGSCPSSLTPQTPDLEGPLSWGGLLPWRGLEPVCSSGRCGRCQDPWAEGEALFKARAPELERRPRCCIWAW